MKINPNNAKSKGNVVLACSSTTEPSSRREWLAIHLVSMVLPVGVFALLTGLFWIGDHGDYSKLYYWLVMFPALLLILVSPRSVAALPKSPIFLAYLSFAVYMAATIVWSDGAESVADQIKRPFAVFALFFAIFELGRRRFDLLVVSVKCSAVIAILAALYALGTFVIAGGSGRLGGYGALRNPLLVSHVFGFFLALWAGCYFTDRRLFSPTVLAAIFVLLVLLFATGARTPLVATFTTILWLSFLKGGKKAVMVIGGLAIGGALIWQYFPEVITQRGLSYRTEIWADVGSQVRERLWFGHGFSTPLAVWVEGLRKSFSDPHNLTLSVLYAGGVVGGGLWLILYAVALFEAWRWRCDKWVLIFSATVVYGFVAGMTEGGAFFSRPKEHWFLIWIPMTLLTLTTFRASFDEKAIRNIA